MAAIESVLKENRVFEPSEDFKAHANVSGMEGYNALCEKANQDYEGFWGELAQELITWKKPFTQVLDETRAPFYKWFADGVLNISYNSIDRHLADKANKTAIIYEKDDGSSENITYQELYERVCRFANGLKSLGVQKGDRVVIYMPMVPDAVVAMQACARIGAIHSVVFGGFSSGAVKDPVQDAAAKKNKTDKGGGRGGKPPPPTATVDEALNVCE